MQLRQREAEREFFMRHRGGGHGERTALRQRHVGGGAVAVDAAGAAEQGAVLLGVLGDAAFASAETLGAVAVVEASARAASAASAAASAETAARFATGIVGTTSATGTMHYVAQTHSLGTLTLEALTDHLLERNPIGGRAAI